MRNLALLRQHARITCWFAFISWLLDASIFKTETVKLYHLKFLYIIINLLENSWQVFQGNKALFLIRSFNSCSRGNKCPKYTSQNVLPATILLRQKTVYNSFVIWPGNN